MSQRITHVVLIWVSFTIYAMPAFSADDIPAWAYPINPPDFKSRTDDGVLRHTPGSTAVYGVKQLTDRFFAPVWHPEDHPPLPQIVAEGRKPNVLACGFCHRENGAGGPENAALAGLPASYIVQQMADYKSGARTTSVPKRNIATMIALAKSVTDEEVLAAAAYFSSLPTKSNFNVIETNTVPKTYVVGSFLAAVQSDEREPIGQRIIEVPVDLEQFENRDPRAQFIVYVPKGSVAKGKKLARGNNNKTMPCAQCHGEKLNGLDGTPAIAGRSPSYIMRQLYDMRGGARAGAMSQRMQPAVTSLSVDDMVSIAAYLAAQKQ